MQRFTARLLLLFALAGTFVPLALAATAAPARACCVRNAHHCHTSASAQSDELGFVVRSAGCCNHDCCRGVTLTQSANPQTNVTVASAHHASQFTPVHTAATPSARSSSSQSTRAPPQISLT